MVYIESFKFFIPHCSGYAHVQHKCIISAYLNTEAMCSELHFTHHFHTSRKAKCHKGMHKGVPPNPQHDLCTCLDIILRFHSDARYNILDGFSTFFARNDCLRTRPFLGLVSSPASSSSSSEELESLSVLS